MGVRVSSSNARVCLLLLLVYSIPTKKIFSFCIQMYICYFKNRQIDDVISSRHRFLHRILFSRESFGLLSLFNSKKQNNINILYFKRKKIQLEIIELNFFEKNNNNNSSSSGDDTKHKHEQRNSFTEFLSDSRMIIFRFQKS